MEQGWFGSLVGDSGVADFLLGAHQALRHGLLAHQESAGHGLGGQSAHLAQSEGDLRLLLKRRMTAGEYEPQPVIAESRFIGFIENRRRLTASALASSRSKILVRNTTSRRIRSIALLRPVLISQARGFSGTPAVHCSIAAVVPPGAPPRPIPEIAEQADQCCENSTRLPAKYFFDGLVYRAGARHHDRVQHLKQRAARWVALRCFQPSLRGFAPRFRSLRRDSSPR